MIDSISSYIKNIAFFLIFSSFVSIILPNGKYKKYIDIVLGLVLIIVVLEPLTTFVFGTTQPLIKAMDEITASLDRKLATNMNLDEEARDRLITENFKERIRVWLEQQVRDYGYELEDLNLTLDIETSEITHIALTLSVMSETASEQEHLPFIRVEKVRVNKIGIAKKTEEAASEHNDVTTDEFQALRTDIADYYGMSAQDIHITVI